VPDISIIPESLIPRPKLKLNPDLDYSSNRSPLAAVLDASCLCTCRTPAEQCIFEKFMSLNYWQGGVSVN